MSSSTPMDVDSDQKSAAKPTPPQVSDDTKRAIKAKFDRLIIQLTSGCGRSPCDNSQCASNPSFPKDLTKQQIFQRAVNLLKDNNYTLCVPPVTVASATTSSSAPTSSPAPTSTSTSTSTSTPASTSTSTPASTSTSTTSIPSTPLRTAPAPTTPTITSTPSSASQPSPSPIPTPTPSNAASVPSSTSKSTPTPASPAPSKPTEPIIPLELSSLQETMTQSHVNNDYKLIQHHIFSVFSDQQALGESFLKDEKDVVMSDKKEEDKDAVMTDDSDKDKEKKQAADKKEKELVTTTDPRLDVDTLAQAYELLTEVDALRNSINNAISQLTSQLMLQTSQPTTPCPLLKLRSFLILLENPAWMDVEYYDQFKNLCKLLYRLINIHQAASHSSTINSINKSNKDTLITWIYKTHSVSKLEKLLNMIQQYITVRWETGHANDCTYAVAVLGLIHGANERYVQENGNAIAHDLFYNESVNRDLNLKEDYQRWTHSGFFSFANYAFILDPASKARILQIDANHQMSEQFHDAYIRAALNRNVSPYLVLKVNRNSLVADTLTQIQKKDTTDFKKPLKVHFIGENGIDEGGLQKEFFQLIVAQIFDPQYGMFLVDEETQSYQFNPNSLDSPAEFELIGIILGLAIYNSVILDVKFPQVIYKKLLGMKVTFNDLKSYNPSLATGFEQLLAFTGDVENTYCRTFIHTYDLYGEQKTVELKKGGNEIALTSENRQEYVNLYTDYILNTSIQRQYKAFEFGFHSVCGGDPLKLCRPEELELIICGSPELDFVALESATRYEDGFTVNSRIIKEFWSLVHSMPLERKKKLLQFCTGSDRVPIKGLASVPLVISRQGPDSLQLPTSHTCFNHLLIPEYSSREKLEKYLNLALENSKGFGLI